MIMHCIAQKWTRFYRLSLNLHFRTELVVNGRLYSCHDSFGREDEALHHERSHRATNDRLKHLSYLPDYRRKLLSLSVYAAFPVYISVH